MKLQNQLERLTILVGRDDITRIKHLAVERRESASQIVRTAMADWLTAQSTQRVDLNTNGQEP